MGEDAIVVFTYKTLGQMREDGGCGLWPIGGDPERLSKKGVNTLFVFATVQAIRRRRRKVTLGTVSPFFWAACKAFNVFLLSRAMGSRGSSCGSANV